MFRMFCIYLVFFAPSVQLRCMVLRVMELVTAFLLSHQEGALEAQAVYVCPPFISRVPVKK